MEVVGRRTIHIRKSTSDMKHATCALTVTASGKMITPLFVFKGKNYWFIVCMMKCFSHFFVLFLGKLNGRIVQCQFPMYPQGMIYACQDNAWMDEWVMLMKVDMVLKSYVDTAPQNVVPLLFLDSYHCHMMNSVVNAIQDLGVEVEHICVGCTSLCQPVDIGINKPFKAFLCKAWEKWMIDKGIRYGTTSP